MPTKPTYLEERFPIIEINRLVAPERNSYKPIYNLSKWFARRASALFRAILLSAVLPPEGRLIQDHFYRNHHDHPAVRGKVVLDPFMGGGTTVVEALRLGFRVIGCDLNPVAYFVTKSEALDLEPGGLEALESDFSALQAEVAERLKRRYRTTCPTCSGEAEAIYVLWAKVATCTNIGCQAKIPMLNDWTITQRNLSVKYVERHCSRCGCRYHSESMLVTIAPDRAATSGVDGEMPWIFDPEGSGKCPQCGYVGVVAGGGTKQVAVAACLCPDCFQVFPVRGPVPASLTCPSCSHRFAPNKGHQSRGTFTCHACGQKDKVLNSIRQYGRPLQVRAYAIQGWCPSCAQRQEPKQGLYNHKFWKTFDSGDQTVLEEAVVELRKAQDNLPIPRGRIPDGFNTRQMTNHLYETWTDMFNERQLLCLGELLAAISRRPEPARTMLLNAFIATLNASSVFCVYTWQGDKIERVFARHDFSPKMTFAENNVWGSEYGRGSFTSNVAKVIEGKAYAQNPWDRRPDAAGLEKIYTEDGYSANFAPGLAEFVQGAGNCVLLSRNSAHLQELPDSSVDLVITDPPYGGNVHYSELSDFFYVWLREVLASVDPAFGPPETPKAEEVVENKVRGKTAEDYQNALTEVFRETRRVLQHNGLMAFTFHHANPRAWVALIRSLIDAGYVVTATFPVQSEAENSLHLMDKQAISHDIIVVCRKRTWPLQKISWLRLRDTIQSMAREYLSAIEGIEDFRGLSPEDMQEVLRGKCLEAYSRHGWVVDSEDREMPLAEILREIAQMVRGLTKAARIVPALDEADPLSLAYLSAALGEKELTVDQLNKRLRGSGVTVSDLLEARLLYRGDRNRTYRVSDPLERYDWLTSRRPTGALPLIDRAHLLLGAYRRGEDLPAVHLGREDAEPRALLEALEAIARANKDWADAAAAVGAYLADYLH